MTNYFFRNLTYSLTFFYELVDFFIYFFYKKTNIFPRVKKSMCSVDRDWIFKSHTYILSHVYKLNFKLYSLNKFYTKQKWLFKLDQVNQNTYSHLSAGLKVRTINLVGVNFLKGLVFFWKFTRFWILPLLCLILVIYFSVITRLLPFNKVVFIWFSFFMIFYWLISGFVFFYKKYQFGKYTTAIQRFWRRSYILFWSLETSLLLVFVYLTFTASQESFYMFDEIQTYKTHLFSWRVFFLKMFPVVLLIQLSFCFLLMLKWNIFSKNSIWLVIFTAILTYIVWQEFYQFFHISNFYGNLVWNFDLEERLWTLELETRRTRIVNHYFMWLLILKFWHLLFVYVFWLFFVLRVNERLSIRFPLYSVNYQNIIILFLMNWLVMLPWIKFYFRKFLDIPYFWFYVNNRLVFSRMFFNDLNVTLLSLTNPTLESIKIFSNTNFYYWFTINNNFIYNLGKKHFIRSSITEVLSL